MSYAPLKSVLAGALATLILLAAADAAAQTGGVTGTTMVGSLSWASDFSWYLQRWDPGQNAWIQMNATEQQYYFNRARCECDGDKTDLKGSFRIAIQNAQNTSDKIRALLNQNYVSSGTAALYAGSNVVNCLTPSAVISGSYSGYCLNLINPSDPSANIPGGMATIAAGRVWYSDAIPVAWLFNAAKNPVCLGTTCDATSACSTATATVTVYFWAQTNSGPTPDMTDSSFNISLVGESAFVPQDVTAKGGNEALTVSWSWPNGLSPSGNAAFMGVQLFCVRGADTQVFESKTFGQSYMTSPTTCPNVVQTTSTGIGALDPDYLCSGLLPSTSNSYRIEGLQNGIWYGVGVAAIDKFGNASPVTTLAYGQPIATVDFYNAYQKEGGSVQGGFCAVAGLRRPGIVGLAAFGVLGLWSWRRRRRRRRGGSLLAIVFLATVLGGGQAQAQAVYHEDDLLYDRAAEVWQGTPRNFAVEMRFGLYTPAIDSEFSGWTPDPAPTPQAQVFGTEKRPMWQLEFDWEALQVFGTLSLGGVVGYYKENAKACIQSTMSASVCEPSGDNTSLRLIPLAALVIYRMDVLAERWKIPIVPYGKVGLNYTLWTVTNGDGNVATSPRGGRGQGGTSGWQAAVGVSLQLDWMDPSSARGFDADVGVNHTYAFFELDTIQSSGLGSKNRLHVGDNTWFAGLMFEF